MTAYRKLPRNQTILGTLGYEAVQESIFTSDSEDLVSWTKFFEKRAYETLDFEGFHERVQRSFPKAVVVSTQWYQFSNFMPYFLCQAAALMPSNEKRHYVIQTAFEELGMRDVKEIHPEMFKQACVNAGVPTDYFTKLANHSPVQGLLNGLKKDLIGSQDDSFVLGMLLGLELPAEDNISSIFWSIAYDEPSEAKLRADKFFRLHMALECEHVRLTVSNFLRFCSDRTEKNSFIQGFDVGTLFWRNFWQELEHLGAGFQVLSKSPKEKYE